jgi:predicted metalloendopeptidase
MHYLHIDLLSTTPANETNPLQCVLNARRLYSSCVDDVKIETDGVQPVLSLLETDFGGWPILQGSSWNNATYNLTNLLLKLRQYNYNAVFRVTTDIDAKNSSSRLIVVSQINYINHIELFQLF